MSSYSYIFLIVKLVLAPIVAVLVLFMYKRCSRGLSFRHLKVVLVKRSVLYSSSIVLNYLKNMGWIKRLSLEGLFGMLFLTLFLFVMFVFTLFLVVFVFLQKPVYGLEYQTIDGKELFLELYSKGEWCNPLVDNGWDSLAFRFNRVIGRYLEKGYISSAQFRVLVDTSNVDLLLVCLLQNKVVVSFENFKNMSDYCLLEGHRIPVLFFFTQNNLSYQFLFTGEAVHFKLNDDNILVELSTQDTRVLDEDVHTMYFYRIKDFYRVHRYRLDCQVLIEDFYTKYPLEMSSLYRKDRIRLFNTCIEDEAGLKRVRLLFRSWKNAGVK